MPPPPFSELVEATEGLQPFRRLFHAAAGAGILLLLGGIGPDRDPPILLLGGISLLLLLLDLIRLRSPGANRLFYRIFRPLASPREAEGIASSTWYGIGVLLTVLLFPRNAAIAGILCLAFADPCASVVGRIHGKTRLGKGSVEGTSVFLAVAFLVLFPFAGALPALAGAIAGAVVEILPVPLDDNLTIPIAVAAALTLLAPFSSSPGFL